MKKVSVIIPMHNSSKHIVQCLESVTKQSYTDIEILVIDDKSSDDSISIVKTIKDERIKLIALDKNEGAAKARNKGIEIATGDYICFLDSDDYWLEDKLDKQVKFMEQNDYTFIYGGYAYLKHGKTRVAKVPKCVDYKGLLKNHTIFTSTVMLNMERLKKEDIYMPEIKRGQDMATWWKILKNGVTAYGITDVLSIYRVGESSLSSNKFKAIKRTWKILSIEEKNFFKRIYLFLCYSYHAVKRRMGI